MKSKKTRCVLKLIYITIQNYTLLIINLHGIVAYTNYVYNETQKLYCLIKGG